MPVEAPEGTIARPRAPPARATSDSIVGLPRESSTSRARTERISLLIRSLAGAGATPLRHLDRLLHRLHWSGDARDPLGVVAMVLEVPGVEPHQGHAVDQGEGDLAQRAVGAVDGDDGVAGEDDGGVTGVADAGEHRKLHPGVRRALGSVVPGEDADGVAALAAGAAADGLHD